MYIISRRGIKRGGTCASGATPSLASLLVNLDRLIFTKHLEEKKRKKNNVGFRIASNNSGE